MTTLDKRKKIGKHGKAKDFFETWRDEMNGLFKEDTFRTMKLENVPNEMRILASRFIYIRSRDLARW